MSLDLNTLATSRPVNHGPLDLCNAINAWFRGSDVGIISSTLNAEKGNCLAANGREEDKSECPALIKAEYCGSGPSETRPSTTMRSPWLVTNF
jgi:hypothetical protein